MRTLYKILFEVKLLHGFYLTDPEGSAIFDLPAQEDRMNFLLDRFSKDVSPVNEDITFTLPTQQQSLFKNYHLRLLASYSGCQVVVEVTESVIAGGNRVYTPLVDLPDDLNLLIGITETRPFLDQVTNARMERPVKAARYFSNERVFGAKVSPSLSSPLPASVAGYPYEQGELANFGVNDTGAYYFYNVGNPADKDRWVHFKGEGFSGELDRLIVSPRFYYSFSATDNVSNALIELRDANGATMATQAFTDPVRLGRVTLDYRQLLKKLPDPLGPPAPVPPPPVLNTLPDSGVGEAILYTLLVTGDNGYNRQVPVIFRTEAMGEEWGWIQIQRTVSDPAYNLLDADGRLVTQTKPDGTTIPHRIFEIWLKSRFTFWRYQNDEGGQLKAPAAPNDVFLDLVGANLVTKTPRFITYRAGYFLNEADDTYHFLPNPEFETLPVISANQSFSNIPVATSTLFPVN